MKDTKYNCLLVTITLLTVIFQAYTQPPDSLWSRTFGGSNVDIANGIQQTSDGGYILAGYTESFGAVNGDFWLVKTDANGDSLWSRTFGGSLEDRCESVRHTSDGGYILAGRTASFGAGDFDSWLVKTDENGDSLWSRTFGGSSSDVCKSIQQTSDGGYILGGLTWSSGAGLSDFWLVKTDAIGDSLWSRTFGGSSYDICYSALQTSDGGYILAGLTDSFGAGLYDFWLVKTDQNGDSLWSRTFGGYHQERCFSVQQTPDGGYILAGLTYSFGFGTPSHCQLWLIKTDSLGSQLWTRTYGGIYTESGYSVQQTSDGGYMLAGHTRSFGAGLYDFWLVKTNSDGDSLWTRTFGGIDLDYCTSAQQTSDGGYILAGRTESFGAGNYDFWLVRAVFSSPRFTSITDVGNDQGRQVRLRWRRSVFDGLLPDYTITGYSIYRRIDEYRDAGALRAVREGLDWPPGEWEYILTVPSRGEAEYATIAPTLADSTSEGIYWSVFFISAETPDPLVYFDSAPDSGYSIDNLPPDPATITALFQVSPSVVLLQWDEITTGGGGQPEQGDIWYRIYGSPDPSFTPSPGNLLTVTQDLEFLHDVNLYSSFFYKIQVSDDH